MTCSSSWATTKQEIQINPAVAEISCLLVPMGQTLKNTKSYISHNASFLIVSFDGVCLSNSMSPVFNADIITSGRYHSLLCFLSIILINIKYDAKFTHDFSVLILLPHVCYVAAETSELPSGKHTIIISYSTLVWYRMYYLTQWDNCEGNTSDIFWFKTSKIIPVVNKASVINDL